MALTNKGTYKVIQAKYSIPNAEFIDIFNTPIQIQAAAGTNKCFYVFPGSAKLKRTGAAFGVTTPGFYLILDSGGTDYYNSVDISGGTFMSSQTIPLIINNVAPTSSGSNSPIQLLVDAGADPGFTGTADLTLTFLYTIINLV